MFPASHTSASKRVRYVRPASRVCAKPTSCGAWQRDVEFPRPRGHRLACLPKPCLHLALCRERETYRSRDGAQAQDSLVTGVTKEVRAGPLANANGRSAMPPESYTTVAALRAWRRRQLEDKLALGPAYDDQGFVFTRADGRPFDPNDFSCEFDRRIKRLGLPRIGSTTSGTRGRRSRYRLASTRRW